MNVTSKKREVFLSHSGLDAHRATELAATLKRRLADLGDQVDVFNTSEPTYRYKDLRDLLTPGEDWRARAEQYEKELRTYLEKKMQDSVAFLSLCTPNSLRAASKVIEFEIETARSIAVRHRGAGQKRPFFFPCVADGASLTDLPRGAQEFQGVELDGEEGLTELVHALHRALSRNVETGE
jgi:hypothetical protein